MYHNSTNNLVAVFFYSAFFSFVAEKTIANIAEELKHAKADNNKSSDSTAQLNDSIKELKLTLKTVDNRIKTINSNLTTMKQDFTGLFNSKQSTGKIIFK